MSKITELQEEFEVLIKELERLKSINEITSINSLKAEMTIDEIKKFIDATEKFISAIKSDYEERNKTFSKNEKALENAISKLNKGVDDQSEKFESITSNSSKLIAKEVDTLKKEWNSRVENYMHQIKDVKKKIETEVLEYSRNTAGTLRTQNSMITEQIENESKAKTRELNLLRIKLEESVDSIKTAYLDGIQELKSEFLSNNEQLKIDISKNASSIDAVMYLVIGFGSVIVLGILFLIFSI